MQRYTPILKLEIRHTYYENGLCKDLRAEPTADTWRLVRDYRLLLRYLPAGLEVHAPVVKDNSKAPPVDVLLIPLPAGLRLRWMLRPQSADFFYFTELPPKPARSIFHITNQGGNAWKKTAGFQPFTSLYAGPVSGPGLPDASSGVYVENYSLQFGLKEPGQEIPLDPPPATDDLGDFTFDPPGPGWSLMANPNGQPKSLKFNGAVAQPIRVMVTYPTASIARSNDFALLDLELPTVVDNPSDPDFLFAYTLQLRAKAVKWQYLIPAGNPTAPALNHTSALKLIVDGASYAASISTLDKSNGPGTANAMAHLVWERMSPAFDKMYYIGSDVTIPYQEKPLADIKIRDTADTMDIITGLRNPRSQDHGLRVAKGLDISNLLTFPFPP